MRQSVSGQQGERTSHEGLDHAIADTRSTAGLPEHSASASFRGIGEMRETTHDEGDLAGENVGLED